jgi:hypothetical protein
MQRSRPNIRDLRVGEFGIRDSFEEFCCQLFRRAEVPADAVYRRVRGDGGDGGVEAFWTMANEEVWGLQSKFFDSIGASQKTQLTDSVRQAAANYPSLTRYTICLPIKLTARTGAKAGKSKRGQHEKFSEWIGEWQLELKGMGRLIAFELWDESELLDRLASVDTTGGLTRYWFDKETLTPRWFRERLTDARAQAGPRYSPELAVATPLDDALHAFGRSELWIRKIEQLATRYSDKLDWWRKTVEGKVEPLSSVADDLTDDARAVLLPAETLEKNLSLGGESPDLLIQSTFREGVRLSLNRARALEPKLKATLLAKHGQGADSPGFRQFRAEYMVDFPMASLDHLRDLLSVLAEIEALAFQPEGQLPAATAMLLRGEAGVGKTHGIVDAALRRHEAGLLSLILFGEDAIGPDPWQPFVAKLGLGGAGGRDAVLDALNAAGETTGFPLVVFIDALNETQPDRRKWQAWLPPMLEQIKRRPSLKLCVSCRETYVRDVIPAALTIPIIEHNGFLGREYEAQFAFFQHYGLGVPAEPLLQEEFANPLFLRLICEALRDSNAHAIPAGREGIRGLINLLLRAKNDRAATACDFDRRENRVTQAMLRLAEAMAAAGTRVLPLREGRLLVDESSSVGSRSLFAVLESESLVATIEQPAERFGGEPNYFVRFTFERIGDHLIAEQMVRSVPDAKAAFAPGSPLHFLVVNDEAVRTNAGILEALSIQWPEAHAQELIDAVSIGEQDALRPAFIAALQWRDPHFVTARTIELVREGLGSNETIAPTLEALLGLAARPDHPLNARFLDRLLGRVPILARDPIWASMLEESYSGWSHTVRQKSGVHRLVETARRGKLVNLQDEVGILWTTTLAWFCASPDRRIRDQATMAMASIFHARPSIIVSLLRKFADNDDEYISERVLVAAYGALLLTESASNLHESARLIYELYFANGEPPLNASLRDHARLIIELSVELGVPPDSIDVDLYRPPYRSKWPISLPSEDDVKPYVEDRDRFPQMNLVEQFGFATGTDFARYIIEPRVTSAFDLQKAGLDKLGIFRWFLQEAADFGYPGPSDQCARFDRGLLSEFGGGRGKPGWAERLGKKYYWTFLRRLVGCMADHVDRKTWSGTFAPGAELQGLDLRDIDPSDLREYLSHPAPDSGWLSPAPYVFQGRDAPEGDAAWMKQDDLTDISQALVVTDPDGEVWQVLDMGVSWSGKRIDRNMNTYRHISRSVRAASCKASDVANVKKAFASVGLDHFNNGPHDYRGYLGEYPRRWPYTGRASDPIVFTDDDADIKFQNLALRQLRGREWERDYSHVPESTTILMPSVELVEAGGLRWDHGGGWYDPKGETQVQDPCWWTTERPPALLCRLEYLDDFLDQSDRALIILGYQEKFIAGASDGPGFLEERTLFVRHRAQTKRIKRRLRRR